MIQLLFTEWFTQEKPMANFQIPLEHFRAADWILRSAASCSALVFCAMKHHLGGRHGLARVLGEQGPSLTYFLHGCVKREEALSKKLVHHLLIVCLDLRHHVTRDEAKAGTSFPTVEPICVFITIDLEPEVKKGTVTGWLRKTPALLTVNHAVIPALRAP